MSEDQDQYNIEMAKRERAALRKYAALQKASEDKIGCQKIYVDIAGGIQEAFILDELIFFTLPRIETGKSGLRVRKDGVLWMAVSRTEWWKRKRLTPKEADGAIERLVQKNLIFKDHFLFNKQKTTHLRLNISEFFRQYLSALEEENPPEEEGETFAKDISDLYEMMGIPKRNTPEGIPEGNTGIPKGNKVSLNGDSINIPDTSLTQPEQELILAPDGAPTIPPEFPVDWQIAAGVEEVVIPDVNQFEIDARSWAHLIAQNNADLEPLAFEFMMGANKLPAEKDIAFWRKTFRGFRNMQPRPATAEDIRDAVGKHIDSKLPIKSPKSIEWAVIEVVSPTPDHVDTSKDDGFMAELEARRLKLRQEVGA